MKLGFIFLFLLMSSCSVSGPTLPLNYSQLIRNKVNQDNSYEGQRQFSIKVVKVVPLGEFPISRINRFHRRLDFKVYYKYTKDCYLLGSTCVTRNNSSLVKNLNFFEYKKRNSQDSFITHLSYLRKDNKWTLYDNIFTRTSKDRLPASR